MHRVSRSTGVRGRILSSEQTALFRCHAKRVKKLAVSIIKSWSVLSVSVSVAVEV